MMSIGKEFLLKTQYDYLGESDQEKGMKQPPIELPYDENTVIDLPDAKSCTLKEDKIQTLIENRKSVRKYSDKPLTLEELAYLLWSTQGIKRILTRNDGSQISLRTVPSAGARHAFETYLLINNVEGLKPGLYRYIATIHKLVPINIEEGLAQQIVDASYGQIFIKTAAVTFLWIADIYRMNYRYGERGYRYIFLDAGHVCQNLYLSALSIDAGVCAIDAYNDMMINQLLDLDGENQFVIYIGTVGKN